CLGGVGAVLALEVSRFARSSEFARLLELARLTDTLVIDADGVYDLADVNDRLLLGVKGTLSEAELHLLASRLHGAKLAAAGRGELRFPLPVGYVWDEDQIVQDPDEEVRSAVAEVFAAFARTGSAFAVVGEFAGRVFPSRVSGGVFAGQLRFRKLIHARVLQILTSPIYAGAYAYGRRRTVHRVQADGTVRTGSRKAKRDEWLVLIRDHHEGYISWQSSLDIEAKLAANHTRRGARPPREGPPLCQGIVHCGVCGRRMGTRYRFGRFCLYDCVAARADHARGPGCRGISARTVDEAVTAAFLQAATPEQITRALQAADEVIERHTRTHRAAELAVQRARYEADRAERAFTQVEPENRLVARTLETRWEAKLQALTEAELALEAARSAKPPLPERGRLAAIAADLPRLWESPATKVKDRKRLLRTLIADITLLPAGDDQHGEQYAVIGIRWQTGATQQITVRRYGPGRTCPEALEFIAARSATTRDPELADQLNAAGFTTGRGRTWDADAVHRARNANGIPAPRSAAAHDGHLTIADLAAKLGISRSAVYDWIKAGKLEAHQTSARRWHIPFDETVEARCRDMIAASTHLGRANRDFHVLCEGEITVGDVAARLGVSTTAVLGWIHAGKLTAHRTRVDRRWHIVWDTDVEARCRDMINASVRLNRDGAVACQGELTIRQLRDRLGIGRGTVLRWIYEGKLTAHQTTQGYWHIPFDETVEAHCRELIEISPNLRRRQQTQRTDAGDAV
ncbi:helix-turn-helix domain-containing protein, partial [Actinomadura sp. KC216]|uniref:helix-turn-helix domain-containing protein n=1 Tax=Actinomadura sp. KC216 TaxID=2530370 RepID=UPI00104516EF